METSAADVPIEETPSGIAMPRGAPRREEPRRKLKTGSLYWFISGRHYVSLVELRRRFQIELTDGTLLRDNDGVVHIGLPEHVASALFELKRKGKIGLEFAPDFNVRIVIGVYPMRIRPPDSRDPDRAA
jgi:hypothetical protein